MASAILQVLQCTITRHFWREGGEAEGVVFLLMYINDG